jgi:hypothetical protein
MNTVVIVLIRLNAVTVLVRRTAIMLLIEDD